MRRRPTVARWNRCPPTRRGARRWPGGPAGWAGQAAVAGRGPEHPGCRPRGGGRRGAARRRRPSAARAAGRAARPGAPSRRRPVAALRAGLAPVDRDVVAVLAGDLPFVTASLIGEAADASHRRRAPRGRRRGPRSVPARDVADGSPARGGRRRRRADLAAPRARPADRGPLAPGVAPRRAATLDRLRYPGRSRPARLLAAPDRGSFPSMRVVIAGAHGRVGRRLGRLLCARGDSVVGIVPTPEHEAELSSEAADLVVLDLEHVGVDHLAAFVVNADVVVFAAGAEPAGSTPHKDEADRAAALLLADAAEQAAVRPYLLMSSMGVEAVAEGRRPERHRRRLPRLPEGEAGRRGRRPPAAGGRPDRAAPGTAHRGPGHRPGHAGPAPGPGRRSPGTTWPP